MAKRPTHPLLQVLFEPWPDSAWKIGRSRYEVFAGQYLLDALDETGAFVDRGYRAVVAGCTTCRRSDADERVHWPDLNDLAPDKPKRRCPQWKRVETIVKAFGGWKRVHYIELAENEGLGYQPVPQRRRVIEPCPACKGTGLGKLNLESKPGHLYDKCEAECGSYGYGTKGEVRITYEGPVRPDRHDMTSEQRRMRI